ncbi:hypothetical protein [Methanobrevibacter sp.]|uniref:hypothetical protein n=1 Tax=Methanobrevibacter sp. TaxID=66852 RepID=UPI00388E8214
MSDIYDYHVEERPRVAVEKFRDIQGDFIFDQLLEHLNLNYDGFVSEYGEDLVRDPTCLNHVIVDLMVRKGGRMKCSGY